MPRSLDFNQDPRARRTFKPLVICISKHCFSSRSPVTRLGSRLASQCGEGFSRSNRLLEFAFHDIQGASRGSWLTYPLSLKGSRNLILLPRTLRSWGLPVREISCVGLGEIVWTCVTRDSTSLVVEFILPRALKHAWYVRCARVDGITKVQGLSRKGSGNATVIVAHLGEANIKLGTSYTEKRLQIGLRSEVSAILVCRSAVFSLTALETACRNRCSRCDV